MATSEPSDTQTEITVQDVHNAIQALGNKKVQLSNENGSFVASKQLRKLERMFGKLSENLEVPAERLQTLKDSMDKLVIDNNSAYKAKKEADDELNKLRSTHNNLVEKHNTDITLANGDIAHLSNEIETQKMLLQKSEKDLGVAKTAAKAAEKGYDPDALVTARNAAEEARRIVKNQHTELSQTKDYLKAAKDSRDKGRDEIKRLEKALSDAHAEAKALNIKETSAAHAFDEPILRSTQMDVARIGAVFGSRAVEILKDLDAVGRTDIRERAYKLLLVTKQNRVSFWPVITGMLSEVFQLCKNISHRVAQKLSPWLNMIENDIKSFSMKSVQYYRDFLKDVLEKQQLIHKEKVKQGKQKKDGTFAKIINTAVATGLVAKERVEKATFWSKLKTVASRAYSFVKRGFSSLFPSQRRLEEILRQDAAEKVVFHDAEEEKPLPPKPTETASHSRGTGGLA